MIYQGLRNSEKQKNLFDAMMFHIANSETSSQEKKTAIDFLVDYVNSDSKEKINLCSEYN